VVNVEGKIIYEVMRVMKGKPIFLEDHLIRMKNSFKLIDKQFDLRYEDINKEIRKLITTENKLEGNIKITYEVNEKVLKIFFVEHSYPTDGMYKDGVKTIATDATISNLMRNWSY
jgi:branched-chain amino acid aminotransferase